MNYLKADIANTANWSQVWSARLEATIFRPGVFTPMDGLMLPVTLSSPLIVVGCFCPEEVIKPTWNYAGSIQAVANLNLFGGSSISRSIFATYSGLINRSRLISIPRIVPNYQIFFRPAKWIERMEVGFFEYIGESSDSILDELKAIQQIESLQSTAIQEIQLTQSEILSKL